MHRHLPRRPVILLFLSLLVLGSAADASSWSGKRVFCTNGTLAVSPTPCPPPPGVWTM